MGLLMVLGVVLSSMTMSGVASASSAGCPNERSPGFRSYLPDCRAYELVSPNYKEGFPVRVAGVSEQGSEVLAYSFGSFSGVEDSSPLGQPYAFRRSEEDWQSLPLDAPFDEFSLYSLEGVSPDFQHDLWGARIPTSPRREDLYSGPPRGPFAHVGPDQPPGVEGKAVLTFLGASEDLSHALFLDRSPSREEINRLWPGDTTANGGLPSLYEYAGTENGEPRLVGLGDSGHLISDCGTSLGSFPEGDTYNAVSASGATVFFTASACGAPGPPVNEIYARIEGSQTVAISEPSKADCSECLLAGPANAEFRGASHDGSEVFFTTAQQLLPGATGPSANLYEYDFHGPLGGRVSLVSHGDAIEANVLGVARVSEDGSHVYFVATGELTGANGEGQAPTAGAPNLYVAKSACSAGEADCVDPAEHISFVATLVDSDSQDWNAVDVRPVQATPDGRFLVFQSSVDLTADQKGPEAGQVFEYDAQTERLIRVSRGQNGYNGDGNSEIDAATIPRQDYEQDPPIQRYTHLAVSGNGSRVFFSTKHALTPGALGGFNNAYEYHDGQVNLISDGVDITEVSGGSAVELIGTDESGMDVFFLTADRLVPQDTDAQTGVYDARINGGPAPATSPASCLGSACRGAGGEPLLPLAPASISVSAEAVGAPIVAKSAPRPGTVKKKKKKGHRHPASRRNRHRSKKASRRRK